MVRLKQLLAFPLYATVAWLVWVLGAQVGNDAVMRIGATLVLIAFALWAWRAWRGGGRAAWATAAIVGALAGACVAWPLFGDRPRPCSRQPTPARRRPIVERWLGAVFGAAASPNWSRGPAGVHRFHRRVVRHVPGEQAARADRCARARCVRARATSALLRADWTRRDPAITRALTALGRSGVPVYVLYRKGGEPLLLPEVLQRQALIDAIAGS